ncbi:MAG: hypothetical protein ACYDB7_02100 [Mycobacteriales bacterium]
MARRVFTAFAVSVTAGAALLMGASPAAAAIGSPGLVISDNQVSASPVTYTATFQVGSAALSAIVALPSTVTGLATSGVTVATSTDGVNFTTVAPLSLLTSTTNSLDTVGVNLSSALVAGDWIQVTMTGLTNPATVGSYTVGLADELTALTQTTLNTVSLSGSTLTSTTTGLLADVGSIVAGIVAQATNGVTTNLAVAPVLSLAWGAASHALSVTPTSTGAAPAATNDTVTVDTNALTYSIEGEISGGGLVLQGGSASVPADLISLGYSVVGGGAGTFSPASTGFATLAGGLAGLTNGTTTTVDYALSVNLTHPAGTYTGTVTYLVTPNF